MLGKLDLDAIPLHEPIIMGTLVVVLLGGAALLAAILDDLDEQVSVALGKNAMRPQPGTSR